MIEELAIHRKEVKSRFEEVLGRLGLNEKIVTIIKMTPAELERFEKLEGQHPNFVAMEIAIEQNEAEITDLKRALETVKEQRDQYQTDKRGQRIYIEELEKSRNEIHVEKIALVEENSKLKAELAAEMNVFTAAAAANKEVQEAYEKAKAERDTAVADLFAARTERDSYKNLAKASEDSCVILIKSLEALRKTLSEKTLNIEYLHKAMDAQQKALDKLRQADLPGTNPPSCGSSVVSDSPPFDPTKCGIWTIEMPGVNSQAAYDQAKRRVAMSTEAVSFTQSGRCRARQLLNDLSANHVKTYQGQRESQLVEVLLLILDELPPAEAKSHYMKASRIVRT